jgi:glycosyltransferase involved in cell wall biosynthesis
MPVCYLIAMKFSVVTPSFRNARWLKLCIASVADQQGVAFEHIVQDACSDDGTRELLEHDPRVQAFIEKDNGMYDAINRGWRRATGDILCYLNCDEQYLPGALASVRQFFETHPQVEAACAHAIVVDPDGRYLCHRHALMPGRHSVWLKFNVLTCAIFLRRHVIHEREFYFDTRWKVLGDFHWFRAMMAAGVRMAICDQVTSAFVDSGDNLCLKPAGLKETEERKAMTPRWVKLLAPAFVVHHRLRRLRAGHFTVAPTDYSIYTPTSPDARVRFEVPHPTGVWKNRL